MGVRRLIGYGLMPLLLAGVLMYRPNQAAAESIGVSLQSFATGLSSPVDIANTGMGGDGRMFVVGQGGLIRIVQSNGTVSGTFLDIDSKVGTDGESGLLSLAFHPNYASNGFFYVFYTNNSGDNVVARYTATGDPATSNTASAASEQIVLTIPHPGETNHNGGDLAFGKDAGGDSNDPYLFVTSGDGGGGNDPNNNAQNKELLLGKILRLDINNTSGGNNYAIPAGNPFIGVAGRDEIWSMGFRNPWRFSFDRSTKDMYVADVGQGNREEFDFESANDTGGRNYGWRCYEGNASFNLSGCGPTGNYTFPVFDYSLAGTPCAIIGGYVYRGSQQPSLSGRYVFADFCSGDFYTARNTGSWDVTKQATFSGRNLSGFGENVDGEVFAADISNGTIYRVVGDQYTSQWAGQSAYPTLASGESTTVYVDYRNLGSQNWTPATPVRLATARSNDRNSGFYNSGWLSRNRPATITGQVNGGTLDTGDTTIEPNQIARFQFTVVAPPVGAQTTFREYFRPVVDGVTFMPDQGVFLDMTVTPRSYAYSWVAQTYPPAVMNPGQTASGLTLDITNTGTATWRRDTDFPTRFGTDRPADRNSGFYQAGNWLSPNRLPNYAGRLIGGSVTSQDTIAAGQTARYQYNVTAPSQPGLYREYVRPVVDGFGRLNDAGIFWETYVRNPNAPALDYFPTGQSAYPTMNRNGTSVLKLQLRNTGTQTWQSNGATPFRLATDRAQDRASGFSNNGSEAGWLSPNRIKLTRNLTDSAKNVGGETSVAEGEIGEFEFTVRAVPPPGTYREFFRPVVDGVAHLRDFSLSWDITVR